jgi:hypothetical protein
MKNLVKTKKKKKNILKIIFNSFLLFKNIFNFIILYIPESDYHNWKDDEKEIEEKNEL